MRSKPFEAPTPLHDALNRLFEERFLRRLGLLIVVGLLIAGCGPSTTSSPTSGNSSAKPARSFAGLVDIGGGRKMYLQCRGSGSPTVVFVSGRSDRADIWSYVTDSSGNLKPSSSAVGFDHRPVHREPVPINSIHFLKLLDACLPKFEEHARLLPFLKAIVCTELRLVQSLPLAARSQHVENRVCTLSIGHARSSAAKTMGVDRHGKQRLQDRPLFVGNPKACRGTAIRRSRSSSLLELLFAHLSSCHSSAPYVMESGW
jgi:hypothetical protein